MNKLIEKYLNRYFTFQRYYKYSFYYENSSAKIEAGGYPDVIYKVEFMPLMTLEEIIRQVTADPEYLTITEI